MKAKDPLFSIITVTYNAEETVRRTMQSVMSQTFDDYEHILMDGVSNDHTLEIVKEEASELTRVLSSPDNGIYDAMNKALGVARGQYVIFLNAGDKFHAPDTLSIIAKTINQNDVPGIVYGQTNLVDNSGSYLGPRHLTAPEILTLDSFKRGMLVCHQAFVVLRRIAPLYNTHWKYSADYEWCIRCMQHSRLNVNTGVTLIDYLAEGLTTANHKSSLKERFKIMCHYYGTLPTILRHIGFFIRNRRRQRLGSANIQ